MTDSSSSNGTDQVTATSGGGQGGPTPLEWQRQVFNDFKTALLASLDEPLADVNRWSWFSLVFAALSASTVLAGCIIALIIAFKWPPGAWTDPSMLMTILSNIVAALATTANVHVNHRLNAAHKELASRRDQIDRITSRLFKRLFGESGEPSVITYAHRDAIAGRLIKLDKDNWEEVSFQGDAQRGYQFKLNRILGNRIFLEDASKPKKRNIELEIDLDFRRILWIDPKTNTKEELYRVLDTD